MTAILELFWGTLWKEVLLFFVHFDSQFLQAFLLTKLQVLQDVLEVFFCIIA